MNQLIRSGILIIIAVFIFTAGCAEPPIKDPVVTVSDIGVSDITLQTRP
jgi:hypothetical protein